MCTVYINQFVIIDSSKNKNEVDDEVDEVIAVTRIV